MKASYTNLLNLYNSRLILLSTIFFLTGCQIDQSMNILKEKLFSETEENLSKKKNLDNKEMSEDEGDIQRSIKKEDQDKISLDEHITKADDSLKKNSLKNTQDLAFKERGKARETESKIVSFFTKIFDDEEGDVDPKLLKEESLSIRNGAETKKNEFTLIEEVDSQEKIINTADIEQENLNIRSDETMKDEAFSQPPIEDLSNNNSIKEDKEFEEADNNSSKTNESLALLNIKPPKFKEKKPETDNLVGLLLPLTGEKSAAGNLVVNSLRYSTLLKPNQLNFKIFDTKGTPKGAIIAAKQGIKNNVKTFIGPIFSDETREVKEFFKNKKSLTFFSLSPDLNNVSENVIVSGQNPEDQISCIVKHITEAKNEKILLIYHADKYGYVIRNSFVKYIRDFGITDTILLDFFEVEQNINLNEEIRKISKFEERKSRLKEEIEKIKADSNLEDKLKKRQIRSLERKLTLDVPFSSIIIASEGDRLLEILSHLAFYDINSENTNIYGTSLWEDSEKKDNVFKGAFYASSLKQRKGEFIQSFKNVFSRDPMSFNFHMHDLLDFVQNYKIMDEQEKDKAVFYGEFSNSKIKSGLMQREIFIKKIKKNQETEEVFNCRLNVI